jgi:iron complex transport system permease protein
MLHVRGPLVLSALAVALVVVFVLSLGIGQYPIAPDEVVAILFSKIGIHLNIDFTVQQADVLTIVRMPRVIMGLFIGAALAVSGAAIQGLFRNPLADPGLIGISAGASFAVAAMIVLGNSALIGIQDLLGNLTLPIAAFTGGLVTTLVIYRLATFGGRTNVATMLLAGIAINALAGAGIGMLISLSNDDQLRDITFWNLGNLNRTTWDSVRVSLPFLIFALIAMPLLARPLNAFLLGESEAGHLGVNVERTKQAVVVLSALAVGAGVAVAGVVNFIGLVVPHLLRLSVGPDHRYVLPGSALLGGVLLVIADLIARTLPYEVPLGIITALVGGPFFLWLLLRDRTRGFAG